MDLDSVILKMQKNPIYMGTGAGKLAKKWGCDKHVIYDAKDIIRGKKKHNSTGGPKILIFDIENAPMVVYAFDRWKQNISLSQTISETFLLSWSAKWFMSNEVMSEVLTPKEALARDDSRIIKGLWKLFDEADILVAHNACVQKDTPILMQDLSWKKAGDLKVGDKLVGFEEKSKPGVPRRNSEGKWQGDGQRKVVPADVTNIAIETRHCLKVVFDNGDEVIATDDHYWLGMSENCRNQQWYRTDKLRVGQRVNKCISKYEMDTSYEAGWMAGFISGEGTLKGNGASIDFCQRPTVVLDKALDYCKKLNINIAEPKVKIGGLGRGDTLYTYTLGGKWKTLETLGKLRIDRLINNLKWDKFGGLASTTAEGITRTIVDIVEHGYDEVAVLETSSATYIADGYPMHNCGFDIPKANGRFIINGLIPPSPYQVIDTLLVAKKQFGFSSNKLDALAGYFGIQTKLDTDFSLWAKCMTGDKEALAYMQKYNKVDSEILEEVLLSLRPWIKNNPNLSLYYNDNEQRCCNCGSTEVNIVPDKFYYTSVGKYPVYRCKCGALSRGRKTVIDRTKNSTTLTSVGK